MIAICAKLLVGILDQVHEYRVCCQWHHEAPADCLATPAVVPARTEALLRAAITYNALTYGVHRYVY